MNLETRLDQRLWEAIRASAESRNFRAAILDGIHFLSDVIRERSGLESDGVALVGQAFGGVAPKLKVNRLQSESEQNVQRGVESLLRGVYQAIRNPRAHGIAPDDERNAVAILLFIDYLLRVVDQSRSPFSLAEFVGKVIDPDFVPKDRYAELLVQEVPANKRVAVCRDVFARRAEADTTKVRFFLFALLKSMEADEVKEFYELLSTELEQSTDEDTERFIIATMPAANWPSLSEAARMRAENKLIQSVKRGKYNKASDSLYAGAFGAWATYIIEYLTLKEELWRVVFTKLTSDAHQEQEYILRFFCKSIEGSFAAPPDLLIARIKEKLRMGDVRFRDLVSMWGYGTNFEQDPNHPWVKPFAQTMATFSPADEKDEPITDDDIPF